MGTEQFQRIFATGLDAVRSGRHGIEGDPRATGRWGPSIVLLPTGEIADILDDLTRTFRECLGDVHWSSGGIGRAHVTIRALEPFAESIAAEALLRYRSALTRAAASLGPLTFEFSGVGISSASVMVCAAPVDDAAARLREHLGAELSADGWFENTHFETGRDPVWYCSIVHFAGPIHGVDKLIARVRSHAALSIGSHTFKSVEICCWAHDGEGMAPRVEGSVQLPTEG